MALVLALSLSGSVSQVSVIVAGAALLGVMVLTLLFFAHAREVKRLREWGTEASDRLAELTREQTQIAMRANQLAQRQAQATQAQAAKGAARPRAVQVIPRAATAIAGTALLPTSPGTAVAGLPVAGELAPAAAAAIAGLPAGVALAAEGSAPPQQEGALAAGPGGRPVP
ncbi:MAG: hypothetical protein WB698_16225, partial [Solirubrobacteraceae bacterium]